MRVPATRQTHSVSPGQTASVCPSGPQPQQGRQEFRLCMIKRIALTVSGGCHLLSANAISDATRDIKPTSERCRTSLPESPPSHHVLHRRFDSAMAKWAVLSLVPYQRHFITYRPAPVKAFPLISGPAGPVGQGAAASSPPGRRSGGAGNTGPCNPGAGREAGPAPPACWRPRGLSPPPIRFPPIRPDNQSRVRSS